MRILALSILIVLISFPVYAADFFPGVELGRLQLISVNQNDGSARVRDGAGNVAQIVPGDRIGAEAGQVIKIGTASITLRVGNGRTKMPVLYGIIEPQQ